jgi:hypothetical protein
MSVMPDSDKIAQISGHILGLFAHGMLEQAHAWLDTMGSDAAGRVISHISKQGYSGLARELSDVRFGRTS